MPRPYNVININGHIVPATKHDAIKKILQGIGAGHVSRRSKGRYRTGKSGKACLCAIGALLTPAQLDEIAARGDNKARISIIGRDVGLPNIEAMTGMYASVAQRIQNDFDKCVSMDEFRKWLKWYLEGENEPNPATAHTGAWHFPVSGE
jgi:hypothetical protein